MQDKEFIDLLEAAFNEYMEQERQDLAQVIRSLAFDFLAT